MSPADIPLSLYVHFPWCLRKCPYCDFNSHDAGRDIDEAAYVDALLADLEEEAALVRGRELVSVFIGGGTPSLMSGPGVARLLAGIRDRIPLASDAEITLEANPGAADAGHFGAYRDAGVNRLSIGVQSFDDRKLAAIGRIHTAADAETAFERACGAGFDNINIDLMYALPGQTLADALADLESATRLAPAHLSWYQLTIEPNTPFYHQPPEGLPDEDHVWEIAEAGRETLAAAGYGQYEVSAYAREGRRCRHNLNYWIFGDYMGIGAGAHGKLSLGQDQIVRRRKERHPRTYMEGIARGEALSGSSKLQDEDLLLELMMNVLRLDDGVPASVLESHTGLRYDAVAPRLHLLRMRGLLEPGDDRIRATDLGRRFLNDVLAIFA